MWQIHVLDQNQVIHKLPKHIIQSNKWAIKNHSLFHSFVAFPFFILIALVLSNEINLAGGRAGDWWVPWGMPVGSVVKK